MIGGNLIHPDPRCYVEFAIAPVSSVISVVISVLATSASPRDRPRRRRHRNAFGPRTLLAFIVDFLLYIFVLPAHMSYGLDVNEI